MMWLLSLKEVLQSFRIGYLQQLWSHWLQTRKYCGLLLYLRPTPFSIGNCNVFLCHLIVCKLFRFLIWPGFCRVPSAFILEVFVHVKEKMGCIRLPQLTCWRFLPKIIRWVRNPSCLSRSVIRPRISHQILKEFSGSHFYLFTWLLESWQIEICGIFREQLCKITLTSGQTVCGTPGNFGSYIHTHNLCRVCFISTCFISAWINIYGMQANESVVTMESKDF